MSINASGADGVKIAVLRKGPGSLEIFRAAAHRRTFDKSFNSSKNVETVGIGKR